MLVLGHVSFLWGGVAFSPLLGAAAERCPWSRGGRQPGLLGRAAAAVAGALGVFERSPAVCNTELSVVGFLTLSVNSQSSSLKGRE